MPRKPTPKKLRKPRGKWLTYNVYVGVAANIHGDHFAVFLKVMGISSTLPPRKARQVANRLNECADYLDQQVEGAKRAKR